MQQHLLYYFKLLKEKTVQVFNNSEVQSADCYLLSKEVLKKTGKTVSETTIKRVFGHTSSKHSPSRYTLDALSQYANFNSWTEFIEKQDQISIDSAKHQDWEKLKKHVEKITRFNIFTAESKLKNKSIQLKGSNLDNYLIDKINSTHNFRVLYGTAHTGKTLSIVETLKNIDTDQSSDIYLYVDCATLFHGAIYGFNPYKWISIILDFGNEEHIKNFCNTYKDRNLGQIHLIFDGFNDELLPDKHFNAFLTNFIDLMQFFIQYSWINITLITRTHIFKKIRQKIEKDYLNSLTKPLFIDLDPLLSLNLNEVSYLLSNNQVEHTINEISHTEISKWLKKPYILESYIEIYRKNPLIHFKAKESLYLSIHSYYWKEMDFLKNLTLEDERETLGFIKGLQCQDFIEPQFLSYNYRLKNNLLFRSPLYYELVSYGLLIQDEQKEYKFESYLLKAYIIAIYVYFTLKIKERKDFLKYVHANFEHSNILKSALAWYELFSIENMHLEGEENNLQEFEFFINFEENLYRKIVFLYNFYVNSTPELKREIVKHLITENSILKISYYHIYTYKKLKNLLNILLNFGFPEHELLQIKIKLLNISFLAWDEEQIYKGLEDLVSSQYESSEFSLNVISAYSGIYHYFKNAELPEILMNTVYSRNIKNQTFRDELVTFEILSYILILIESSVDRILILQSNLEYKLHQTETKDTRIKEIYKKLLTLITIKLTGNQIERDVHPQTRIFEAYRKVDIITIIDKILQLHIDMNKKDYDSVQIARQEENIKQILKPMGYNLLNKYFSIAGRFIISKRPNLGMSKLVFDINQFNKTRKN